MVGNMSTRGSMKKIIFIIFFCSPFFSSCGGGSSGTGIGDTTTARVNFSGILVSPSGEAIQSAEIALLNTDNNVQTNEAGAFELQTDFPGGDATFEITLPNGKTGDVTLNDVPANPNYLDFSIVADTTTGVASLLKITLLAKITRECAPAFLNSKTIKQTSALPEGFICTIETEIKSDGIPINNLFFQLEHRGCDKNDPWKYLSTGKTGTSGPGIGELQFNFQNNEDFCVYRIIGPIGLEGEIPLFTQLNTLAKKKYDQNN